MNNRFFQHFRWEKDPNYCTAVQVSHIYSEGPRLLDLIDTAIFDFLIGNADRHRYETLGNQMESVFLMLDNGKRFISIHFMLCYLFSILYM